jgi:hypothetical protein
MEGVNETRHRKLWSPRYAQSCAGSRYAKWELRGTGMVEEVSKGALLQNTNSCAGQGVWGVHVSTLPRIKAHRWVPGGSFQTGTMRSKPLKTVGGFGAGNGHRPHMRDAVLMGWARLAGLVALRQLACALGKLWRGASAREWGPGGRVFPDRVFAYGHYGGGEAMRRAAHPICRCLSLFVDNF